MSTGNELTIELIAKDHFFAPQSIITVIASITETLSILGRDVAEDQELDKEWVISKTSMQSPLQIEFSSRELQYKDFGDKVLNKTIFLYEWLQNHQDLPEGYPKEIVEPLKSITTVLHNGVRQYKLKSYGRNDVVSTPQLNENISKVVELYTKENYTALTTLKGKMHELTAKSPKRKPHFSLFVKLYKKNVNCIFHEDQFDDIKQLLEVNPIDIIVDGKAKFNAKGEPLSIEVKNYKKIATVDKIIQLEELYEPDFTGTLDTSEYLFQIRNGEW